jgi:DNA-binding CsgD family transcriptional regulator/tetratricopeptide (TPR) repeat protein
MSIELAALRLRVVSPAVLRKRLATSVPIKDEPDLPRHQLTLWATLAWSESLLRPSHRAIFHRLSVFAGGFNAAAAEVVCAGSMGGETLRAQVLDGLVKLTDHGLLNREIVADEPRFTIPETICEYALERLEASGEAETARRRHATYFLTLAEDAAPALLGPDQEAWLARHESEHDNLRAALRWSLAHDPALSLRLAAALWRFWSAHGYIHEGRRWLERTLDTGAAQCTIARVRALNGLGVLVWIAGDHDRARELQNASLTLAREIGDSWGVAAAQGDIAIIEFDQSGDAARAREVTEDVLRQFQALGDRDSEGIALTTLGNIACRQGDLAEATTRFREALTIARESGDNYAVELSLCNLALSSRLKGDVDQAANSYVEALKLAHRLGHSEDLLYCLAGIGGVEVARGRFESAARLLGAAAAMADVVGTPMQSLEQEQFDRDTAAARAALLDASFSKAWNLGRSLSLDAVVAEVLDAPDPESRSSLNDGLSDREIEVLRLLAMGMSDREIAAALFISPGTATTHVRNIRGKLGVRSRGAAAALAVRHGIAGDRRRHLRRSED